MRIIIIAVIAVVIVLSLIFWLFPWRSSHQEWFRPAEYPTIDDVSYAITVAPIGGSLQNMTGPWRVRIVATGNTNNSLQDITITKAELTTREGIRTDLLDSVPSSIPFSRKGQLFTARSLLGQTINPPFHSNQVLTLDLKWKLSNTNSSSNYSRQFTFAAATLDWSGFVFRPSWKRTMAYLQSAMEEYRSREHDRLMTWKPGMDGYSHDDIILAVGLQCREKQYLVADVLDWLGVPDKVSGDPAGGQLVYFYTGPNKVDPEDESVYMFDVFNGRVVEFATIARFRNNSIRPDGTPFNYLDVMEPFEESAFR